jgi:hypothetical protein
MNPIGGNNYSADIPLGDAAYQEFRGGNGGIGYYIIASDKVGNSGSSGTSSVYVQYCPG